MGCEVGGSILDSGLCSLAMSRNIAYAAESEAPSLLLAAFSMFLHLAAGPESSRRETLWSAVFVALRQEP